MKYCQKCGKEMLEEAVVCTNCGCSVAEQLNGGMSPTKFCQTCGKEIHSEAVVCPGCGCSVSKDVKVAAGEEASIGLCFLSFFLPLVGLILWAVKRNEEPMAAKKYLKLAIISWCIAFFGGLFFSLFASSLYYMI